MRHRLKVLVATAGVIAWTAAIGNAAAESFRLPKAGAPAVVAESLPGWVGQYVTRTDMMLSIANDTTVLELSVMTDPVAAAKTLPQIADRVFKDNDLPHWTDSEPETIAGLQGQAFLINVDRGQLVAFRIILVKIDPTHIARITEIAMPKQTTAEQLAGLKTMVSRLSVSGH